MNGNGKLDADTLSSLELWARLQSHHHAQLFRQDAIIDTVNLLENVHTEWRKSVRGNIQLLDQNSRLKRQLENCEKALEESKKENHRLDSELVASCARVDSLLAEIKEYEKRFRAVKVELQNAPIAPTPEPPPLGYEARLQTNRESQRGKRRSSSPRLQVGALGQKRSRNADQQREMVVHEEDLEDDESVSEKEEKQTRPTAGCRRRIMNRSMSESRVYEPKTMQKHNQQNIPVSAKHTTSTLDIRINPLMGFGNGWTKGRPVEECTHNFVPSNNLFSAAFSYCSVCTRGLGMRSLKCNDCKLQIHENCSAHSPMPCVPMISTPMRSTGKQQRPRLPDFCPETQPQIPGQLIRCVFALEKGFINTVGLYRVPGCDSEVKRLKDQFNSKYAPKLDQIDPETLTGFIKKFLRDLREPLIPFSSFNEFHKAVEENDEIQLKTAIQELPLPNRDTLAFVCAHWQKVAMHSNENQMSLENLARVLGPTVVGTSNKLTIDAAGTGYGQQASRQIGILLKLLQLDHGYWTSFYNAPTLDQQQWPLTPTSSRNAATGQRHSPAVTQSSKAMDSNNPVCTENKQGLVQRMVYKEPHFGKLY